jgi:hypothetical protein
MLFIFLTNLIKSAMTLKRYNFNKEIKLLEMENALLLFKS